MPEEHVEVSRAIITIGNMLLVARGPGEGFVHLPGGHLEAGEAPGDALVRELREELGRELSSCVFLITFDNVYDRGATTVHETTHVFQVTLYPALVEQPPRSAEDHLRFQWVPLQDLERVRLMPPALLDLVHTYAGA
jgi:8-oxo-dGTP pyrophosphatase MutT (NUDIX family)